MMDPDLLAQCQWPPLDARYTAALRAAVTYILDRFQPHGLVASGSIIRGNPDPTSDFDLYVLHAAPWRQRVQKWFAGVPAEIFVNPPAQVEQYFAEEGYAGRPITAHMLTTGFVMLDVRGEVARLRDQARQLLNQPPDTSPIRLTTDRYMAALLYEDAVDIAATRPENARLILGVAVDAMLRYAFIAAGRNLPRHKEMLRTLEAIDPALAALAYAYFRATATPECIDLAGQIADRTLGVRGFFEWETPAPDS